jgi:putative membrane protein
MLKGMAMGIAEVIPGVSGGTIAFITGIYETLIESIKSILGPEIFRALKRGGFKEAWKTINGGFLLFLFLGMALGFVAGVFGVASLLESYPVLVWAFFFGLIIASAVYIGRQVGKWGLVEIIGLMLAVALAYWITIATPAQGTDALWMVFVAGAIAISALILPGISGSFILLLMGMYTVIFPKIKDALSTLSMDSLFVVFVFGLGCLFGLATFARLLSWTFKKYHNTTLAVLTGFMIGSLNKIWPWRNVLETRIDSSGEVVPFLEKSVLPAQFEGNPYVLMAIVMMVIGILVVFLLERVDQKRITGE